MDIRDRAGLKQEAAQRLQSASYDPKKLTLLHGSLVVAISLVISLLSLFLSLGVDATGGLSGIGIRNLLETVQSVLQLGYTLLIPFWQIGILFAFMCMMRKQSAGTQSLLRGFHRFGPVLRLLLSLAGIYLLLGLACAYVSSFLAMSISPQMYTIMEPIAQAMVEDPSIDPYALMAQLPQEQLLSAMTPMLIIFGALYMILVILLGYRIRFANYLVLDDPRIGAFEAIKNSFRLTKGHCLALFKLDLSFWPYYVLQALAAAICYLDIILASAGISLPLSSQWISLIAYSIYGAVILTVDYFMRPKVEATYALAYDSLKNPPPAIMKEKP